MTDAFISYSRKDQAFVRLLFERLEVRGREIWVDWDGIPPTAEWMDEIQRGIEAADSFIFVLSPASLASRICLVELDYATEQGKRLVPVVHGVVDARQAPESLAKLNWIFFTAPEHIDEAITTLFDALDRDLDYVQRHTRVLMRMRQWVRQDEDESLLMRGRDLADAERWLSQSGHKDPLPIPDQTRYLLESRSVETRRQRRVQSGIIAALIVALTLAAIAFWQRNQAEEQRRLAVARALATQSELEALEDGEGLVRGALLAAESLRSTRTFEGVESWKQRVSLLPRRPRVEGARFQDVSSGVVNSDGTLWAMGTREGGVIVGSTTDGSTLANWTAIETEVQSLAFSPDARWLAIGAQQALVIWRLNPLEELVRFTESEHLDTLGNVHELVFSNDGDKLFVASEGYGVEVISTEDWQMTLPLQTQTSRSFALDVHPTLPVVAIGGFGVSLVDSTTGIADPIDDVRQGEVHALRFSGRGNELVAVDDGRIRVWDVEPGPTVVVQFADQIAAYDEPVHDLRFDSSGRYIAVARDPNTVHVLGTKTGAESQRISTSGSPRYVGFSSGADELMTIGDRYQRWDLVGRDATHYYRASSKLKQAFFIGKGKWVVTSDQEGGFRLFESDGLEMRLEEDLGAEPALVLSPDSNYLAAVGQAGLIILDTANLREVYRQMFSSTQQNVELRFDPRSRFVLVTSSSQAGVVDLASGQWSKFTSLSAHSPMFSDSSRWMAFADKTGLNVFNTETGLQFPPLQGKLRAVNPEETRVCTWTPAVRGKRTAKFWIWDLLSGETLGWGADPDGPSIGRTREAVEITVSDPALVDACRNWTAIEWDTNPPPAPRKTPLWTLEPSNSTLRLFSRETGDMIDEVCRRVTRNLTAEEWCQFLPDVPYRATCENLPLTAPDSLDCDKATD